VWEKALFSATQPQPRPPLSESRCSARRDTTASRWRLRKPERAGCQMQGAGEHPRRREGSQPPQPRGTVGPVPEGRRATSTVALRRGGLAAGSGRGLREAEQLSDSQRTWREAALPVAQESAAWQAVEASVARPVARRGRSLAFSHRGA